MAISTAHKLSQKPSQEIQEIAEKVQAVADATQSEAFQFVDFKDGSRMEVRCYPKPRSQGNLAPFASVEQEGSYHVKDEQVYECRAVPVDIDTGEEDFFTLENSVDKNDATEWVSQNHAAREIRVARIDDGEFAEVPVEYRWVKSDATVGPKTDLYPIQQFQKL